MYGDLEPAYDRALESQPCSWILVRKSLPILGVHGAASSLVSQALVANAQQQLTGEPGDTVLYTRCIIILPSSLSAGEHVFWQ